ncbi:MAG: hypothetical protein Q8K96_13360 [Rubrivivax sp.]|nr:hypothetical protein [Rubrivivax sp.]
MKNAIALSAVLLSLAASAAAPKTNLVDHSARALIDEAAAKGVMAENIPAKVWKLYPASKYAFVSQVEGGLVRGDTCVVTARVMLVPLTPAMKAVLLRPQKTATAFDALAKAGADQCKALARDKLKEATTAVVSGLVKT